MRHPNWRVAGATGLAAGLTIGGFSLVSASSLDRAVQTVEAREGQAAPATSSAFRLVTLATAAPEGSLYTASPDRHTAAPSLVVTAEQDAHPTATPHPTPQAIPKVAANVAHVDDCADCSDCANGVHCADSATSVDSVNSVNSVNSVDSCDSDD